MSKADGEYVYFIQPGTVNAVKIGVTKNGIKAAINGLQRGCPVKLHGIGTLPGDVLTEKRYHKLFAKYRIFPDREWFDIEGELLDFLVDNFGFWSNEYRMAIAKALLDFDPSKQALRGLSRSARNGAELPDRMPDSNMSDRAIVRPGDASLSNKET